MRQEPKAAKLKFGKETKTKKSHPDLQLVDQAYIDKKQAYSNFDQINGLHPWQVKVPEGYIAYQARVVHEAKVAYFNFELAQEMGLISKDHKNEITPDLEKKLIETFSLQIINEYDIENNKTFPQKDIKPNLYMATRYLQLQHPNKQGKTSGDGRSIWNGYVESKSGTWDVSSRGTGVTALSPGTIEAGKNLETGNESYGYGCGLCEIDELYATAIMSEIFHKEGIPTERTLLVLETGEGVGIGVRASKNLVRPAHLFAFLKQSNHDALKRATDYFLERQEANNVLQLPAGKKSSYKKLLKHITKQYAEFAAKLESEYIFAWFDWDGDNMLMDIGILDYGSIRQFGIRHDEYRYDDVTRYSTNLNEQKDKTRLIVQNFCQMVDFLCTEKKTNIKSFENAKELRDFDKYFNEEMLRLFSKKLGLSDEAFKAFDRHHKKIVQSLFEKFQEIEKAKYDQKAQSVDDGVNRAPLFNARKLLQMLPELYESELFDSDKVYYDILAEHCKSTKTRNKYSLCLVEIFELYSKLRNKTKLSKKQNEKLKDKVLRENHPERITGNSITYIVNEILDKRSKSLKGSALQRFIDMFVYNQIKKTKPDIEPPNYSRVPSSDLKEAFAIVKEHNEDI